MHAKPARLAAALLSKLAPTMAQTANAAGKVFPWDPRRDKAQA